MSSQPAEDHAASLDRESPPSPSNNECFSHGLQLSNFAIWRWCCCFFTDDNHPASPPRDINSGVHPSENNHPASPSRDNNSGVPPSDDIQPASPSRVINHGMAVPDDYSMPSSSEHNPILMSTSRKYIC